MLALVVASALVGVACKAKEKGAEAQKKEAKEDGVDVALSPTALEAAGISVIKVKSEPRRSSVTAAGVIDFAPGRVARIGPTITGRVASVLVIPGQKIAKGATVVTLEGVDVGRARSDWATAKSRMEQADAELAREEKLAAGGAASERSLQVARTEKRVAESELRAAEARLGTLGVRAADGSRSSVVPLTAPLAGTVLEVKARIGQPVGGADTLVIVGETTEVWLSVDIYERDVDRVRVGNEARVTSVAFPNKTFTGKVDQIDSIVDPERHVLRARIVLQNVDGTLRPGMTVNARLIGETESQGGNMLTVPRGAIQTIDGAPFVFVEKTRGKYELRAVERGLLLEDSVEIGRGLTGNETIVNDGSFILKSEVLREQMGTND